MKRKFKVVRCESGEYGWQARLQDRYESYAQFLEYASVYALHTRLGYKTPRNAWLRNPMVQNSTNPSDYRKVKLSKP